MGILLSSMGDYWDTHMMMTVQQELHFRFDYLKNLQYAQAWGMMQAQAQGSSLGISYAGNAATAGVGGGPNAWGYGYGFWQSINNAFYGLGFFMIALGAIASAIAIFMGAEPQVLFGTLWGFMAFLSHHIMFNTPFGQSQIMYSTMPLWCTIGGVVVAGIYAFGVYGPSRGTDNGATVQLVSGIVMGLMAALFLTIGGSRLTGGSGKKGGNGRGGGPVSQLPNAGMPPQQAIV